MTLTIFLTSIVTLAVTVFAGWVASKFLYLKVENRRLQRVIAQMASTSMVATLRLGELLNSVVIDMTRLAEQTDKEATLMLLDHFNEQMAAVQKAMAEAQPEEQHA